MTAYYNEHDPDMAAWLRELIKCGHIADGIVDERSIKDVCAADLVGFTQQHYFAGLGGWSLALRLAGWPDERPIWTGSCPCQPYSTAGKQKANADERNLWPEFYRLIRECRPEYVIGEQVSNAIRHGWLDGVFADLEAADYACRSIVLGAHSVSAPHIRQRLFWGGRLSVNENDRTSNDVRQGRGEPDAEWSGCRLSNNASSRHADAGPAAADCERKDSDAQRRFGGHESARGGGGIRDAINSRLQGHAGNGDGSDESRWFDSQAGRPIAASDSWSDYTIAEFRDGKRRRVGRSYVKVVDGVSCGVGRGESRISGMEVGSENYEGALINGTTTSADTTETLPPLREAVNTENAHDWPPGGNGCVSETNLLRSSVHGGGDGGKNKGSQRRCVASAIPQESEGIVRELRTQRQETRGASCGWQSDEQRQCELEDAVRFMSSSMSFAKLHCDRATEDALLALQQAIRAEAALHDSSETIQKIWRSLTDEEKKRVDIRSGERRWLLTECGPLAHGIPHRKQDPRMVRLLARLRELGLSAADSQRVIREARSNRRVRLHGYGNSIIARTAEVFIRAFMETFNENL